VRSKNPTTEKHTCTGKNVTVVNKLALGQKTSQNCFRSTRLIILTSCRANHIVAEIGIQTLIKNLVLFGFIWLITTHECVKLMLKRTENTTARYYHSVKHGSLTAVEFVRRVGAVLDTITSSTFTYTPNTVRTPKITRPTIRCHTSQSINQPKYIHRKEAKNKPILA